MVKKNPTLLARKGQWDSTGQTSQDLCIFHVYRMGESILYSRSPVAKGYRISTISSSMGVQLARMSPWGCWVCDLCISMGDVCPGKPDPNRLWILAEWMSTSG